MLNEEIRKLDELREQGIISDEEYELKKQHLYNAYSTSNDNRTTSSVSKKFEIFASLSYFFSIPSTIIVALCGLLTIIGIFFGFNGATKSDSVAISGIMGYFVFIFSIISLALSIPALIFGRISKKGVIVNVNRSRRGNTLSLISLIASIVLIILGLIVLIVAITKTGTSSYNYYNYF